MGPSLHGWWSFISERHVRIEGRLRLVLHELLVPGLPLRLNLSRLRKSRFDRALHAAEGDLAITANLMGNTPRVWA